MSRRITLDEFIISTQDKNASGEFSGLLRHLGIASKIINRVVNKAGLLEILGVDGSVNSTGDTVQKLDTYANELMIEYLKNSGICAGIASEENDYASQAFLHQFLLIQVQEEKEVQDLLRLIEMGPNDPALIMMFDEKVSELAGD